MPAPRIYPGDDQHNARLRARAAKALERVKERRRAKVTNPADGVIARAAPPGTTETLYPSTVADPVPGDPVLMDGANTAKIGGRVLVGRLKGAAIWTLALEERRTCPETCLHFLTCYGNNMGRARRWRHGPALEAAIRRHVASEIRNGPMLVRLHMLGDFYSLDYLRLWVELIDTYPDLHLFGFTAWGRGTSIGDAVHRVREAAPDQFAIRTSGQAGRWGSWTLDWPTEKRFVHMNGERAVVCPEQLDANAGGARGKHCGNCAACWESEESVAFIEH